MNEGQPNKAKVLQFKCSACDFVSSLQRDCDRHICLDHLGQALINDESGRDLTRAQMINGFNKAIKLLKVLKCKNCSKSFRSGLGFKIHTDLCGKNEEDVYQQCEICGKRLKISSIRTHTKQMHQQNNDDHSRHAIQQSTTTLDTTYGSKKRNSAIQARKLLQSLISDVQQEEKDLNEKDMDFPIANVSDDSSSEDSIDNNDDVDDDDDIVTHNVHVDQQESVFSDSSDEEPPCPTDRDLDKILSALLDYIVRQGKSPTVDQKLSKELKVDSRGQLHCYNKTCGARFNFRVHLENHYRRCFNGNFGFQCSYQECRMKSAKIHFILAHFFKFHQELIDLHSLEEFKDYYRNSATFPKNRSRNKSDFKSMIDFQLNILSLPKVFPCLKPVEDCFQLIETDFRFATGVRSFKFKCTGSMDAGDNDLKHIEPLKSLKVDENCLMFNVGQCVTCTAWCPLPLIEIDQSNDDMLECQSRYPRDQYLALATSHYEDSLKLHSTPVDHVCLQIWNVGRLSHSGCTANDQARLALNIQMTDYGDVLDMCWCPFGSSYQNFDLDEWKATASSSLVRLGLLATATEDGWVRIYSLAHPIQLKGSYQICNLYKVKPSLILRNRFDKYSNCNSIHWYPHYPFDMIIASYNDGHVCLWKLTPWANCSDDCSGKHGHHKSDDDDDDDDDGSVLLPHQLYIAAFLPVFCVRWINRTTFMATTMYACKLYHIEYEEVYDEIVSRIAFQKMELHPLWTNLVLLMDLTFARQSSAISIRCLSTPLEDNRFNAIVSSEDTHYQDMSLSPWMCVLAFTTENGQLCTTQVLNRSLNYLKKLPSFLLYSIKLGNLQVDTLNQQQQKQNSETASKSKPKPMNNVLINKTLDLDHCLEQFSDKYYFIFDDIKKPQWTFKSGRKISSRSQELTKNDLYRYYSIIKCAWNPNLSSYSWLFSASKAGICRLNNYPLVRWPTA